MFQKLLDLSLVCLFFALLLLADYRYETQPHWVKIMNGDRVIRSYTTTNSFEVSYYATNILTSNGPQTVMRTRTNVLWTTFHIFR